jgi:AcrR family transcriptional regulator
MSVSPPSKGIRRTGSPDTGHGDVRERLLSAAAEVFAVSGYHASRVSDIVGRAGVAQGTFYLYFRSKEAIFLELADRFFARILAEGLDAYDPRDAASPEDVVAQVRAMWRVGIIRSREQPALVMTIVRDAPSLGPAVRDLVRGFYEHVADGVAAYMTVASERGLVRRLDPRLAGWLLTGLAERAMYYAVAIAPEADADWLADQLMTLEGGGLLAHWDDAWLTARAAEGGRSR